jgi:hypothetical protein
MEETMDGMTGTIDTETDDENIEEFWADLLAFIEDRCVIPVLGRELATVTIEGKVVPLYSAVAKELLQKYGLNSSNNTLVRPHQELDDAIVAVVQRKNKRVQDLYRPVNDILSNIMEQQTDYPYALKELAGITDFDLFITTTFDDLLINTIDQVRNPRKKTTDSIVYAPRLQAGKRRDIPANLPLNYQGVFYLFGRASIYPEYAIHEEDTLEFAYNLLSKDHWIPEAMIGKIRERNLLFIGCDFPDWLSRYFIRLMNTERLSSDRLKKEFLVGTDECHEESFTLFLERFSQNSRVQQCNASSFIKELSERWHKTAPMKPDTLLPVQIPKTGDVFISYSSADLIMANAICEELKAIGVSAWFDKEQIMAGDQWEQKIMKNINHCKIFLPLLSSSTESNVDAFFSKEWAKAVDRVKMFPKNRCEIIPVCIDQDCDKKPVEYDRIPEIFRQYQVERAPSGHMSDQLKGTIKAKLSGPRREMAS